MNLLSLISSNNNESATVLESKFFSRTKQGLVGLFSLFFFFAAVHVRAVSSYNVGGKKWNVDFCLIW